MAIGNVQIVGPGGHANVPTFTARVEAAATAIVPGEPLKRGGTGANYAIPLATGDPEITADLVLGVSANASSETATADGIVQYYPALPGLLYRTAATTPANIDTDAKLLALEMDRVTYDLTGAIYTVDENEGDNSDHGLVIIGGNIVDGTLDYLIRHSATLWSNNDV